ncbi:DUF5133 domain-containing protein [Streptomyces rochei]|uniref:DUF5133 domain-containing protein n=1 Tax=Streptomyces TaxID=1883 RepID=UPI00031E28B5|nr:MULTISPECIES: DUF5133 domain-containing protein [Streptomyces]RIH58911.1 DUF5133 domain-containing protein [Streptomyces sp. SHP22-7]KYK12927.1 hypothetical protein AUW26_34950 [Streptomyces sp. CC71]MBJ6623162.1 DUF5133 domain-containing protein [Streptomyces sp. DHE17-7]NUV94640.1 DUF5133 domain-containing protein [Streptomyces sp. KAI 90]RSS04606.1 DUF5133 domain-containing protein [Streptomyces sp. WAC04189]
MILPAEKELRAVLARFAQARIDHDVRPSGSTSRLLEDATYTLCVMTGARTAEQALRTADELLAQFAERAAAPVEDEALAA